MINTRFAVATHILTLLHHLDGRPVPSELIGASVNTNPSLIRRLLTYLAKAGLTTAQLGAGGGALLARPADTITLLDVHKAMADDATLLPIHDRSNPLCPVGRHIAGILDQRIRDAENAFENELARTTIADLCAEVDQRES